MPSSGPWKDNRMERVNYKYDDFSFRDHDEVYRRSEMARKGRVRVDGGEFDYPLIYELYRSTRGAPVVAVYRIEIGTKRSRTGRAVFENAFVSGDMDVVFNLFGEEVWDQYHNPDYIISDSYMVDDGIPVVEILASQRKRSIDFSFFGVFLYVLSGVAIFGGFAHTQSGWMVLPTTVWMIFGIVKLFGSEQQYHEDMIRVNHLFR